MADGPMTNAEAVGVLHHLLQAATDEIKALRPGGGNFGGTYPEDAVEALTLAIEALQHPLADRAWWRRHIATMVLPGVVGRMGDWSASTAARDAVKVAEALLVELDKTSPPRRVRLLRAVARRRASARGAGPESAPVRVTFPRRFRPLPPGYEVVQLDSGHYIWTWGPPEARAAGDYTLEGLICWDRFWVRRCAFAHFEEAEWTRAHPELAEAWETALREDRSREYIRRAKAT